MEVSDADVRDGVQCFEDDREILAAAVVVGVPGDALISLPGLLQRHPGVLDGEEACRAFHAVYGERVEPMIEEVSAALGILEPLFRHEVDPDYFGTVLGTLVYLAMERFCSEEWKVSRSLTFLDTTVGCPLTRYADAIANGGRQEARKAHARIMATDLGRLIDRVVQRKSRRMFTLLVVGGCSALAIALAQIFTEILRLDTG